MPAAREGSAAECRNLQHHSEFAFEFEIRNERYLVDDLSAITPVTAAQAG